MAAPATSFEPFRVGSPRRLFDGPYISSSWADATTADGERFLLKSSSDLNEANEQLVLVEIFDEELKGLVPTD